MAARELHHTRANRHWTPAEEKMLTLLWGSMSIVPLSKKMGRSVDAIVGRANRMGLGSPSRGHEIPVPTLSRVRLPPEPNPVRPQKPRDGASAQV